MKITVYLAGPYSSRDVLAEYRDQLTRIGFTVRARWLDGQHERDNADGDERAMWAREDLEDVGACDVLVAFTSAAAGGGGMSGGRHIETGYALGQHKKVYLVGEPENVFHWLPGVTKVPTWAEAVIELSALLVSSERQDVRAMAPVSS